MTEPKCTIPIITIDAAYDHAALTFGERETILGALRANDAQSIRRAFVAAAVRLERGEALLAGIGW